MKKFAALLLLYGIFSSSLQAQYSRYIIRLKDKNGSPYLLTEPSAFLSSKAISRRIKQKINLDLSDLPVSPVYLDSIRNIPNVNIVNFSKWMNQVLIQTTDSLAIAKINAFSFVRSFAPIALRARWNEDELINKKFKETIDPLPHRPLLNGINKQKEITDTVSYGNTYNQVHIHEGEYLHNLGFRGEGITIAILDAGFFGYKTNPALDSVRMQNRILGEYDFVQNEQSVNEDNTHGLYCFSIIAANRPGIMVGTAPQAKFWLFRTEDVNSEYPVEEQNWAVAAERADSAGADMISSSLGYSDFDDPAFNHSYPERDGNTSIITRAADMAAAKGMIVMNSAGNTGGLSNDLKYVSCPADGDSVVAVGAVDGNGQIAGFSSWGPNGAGKLKPNIVSLGQGTIVANTSGNPAAGSGTSFSSPNIAGLIACLWQAFQEFTNMDIINAVQKSSSRYTNPDDRYGYGIPNFRIAYGLLQKEREKRYQSILKADWLKAFPVPFKNTITVLLKAPANGTGFFQLVDVSGRVLQTKTMQVQQDNYYYLALTPPVTASGIYYLHYSDGKNKSNIRLVRL